MDVALIKIHIAIIVKQQIACNTNLHKNKDALYKDITDKANMMFHGLLDYNFSQSTVHA